MSDLARHVGDLAIDPTVDFGIVKDRAHERSHATSDGQDSYPDPFQCSAPFRACQVRVTSPTLTERIMRPSVSL
jgi:hypothetical protein